MHPKRFINSALTLTVLLAGPHAVAQTTNEDLQKQITALEQAQKAILEELQELKQLLQTRGVAPPNTTPSSVSISRQPSQGSSLAKIAIIEYSDYQCPFCGRYARDTFPQLETDYIKTGGQGRDAPSSVREPDGARTEGSSHARRRSQPRRNNV